MANRLLTFVLVLAGVCPALGAGVSVHGRVGDPSGSALPGVVVTIRPASGGEARTAVTDGTGTYEFVCVPGKYTIRAELSGFNPVAVDVTVGSEAVQADLSMALAGYAEQVTVKAEAPPNVVGTPQPNAPVTVTREVMDAGMLPNSQFDDVLPLLPNVVRGPDGQIAVAGARAQQSAIFVNGFNETDPIVGQPKLLLPLEAVDTMEVFAGGYVAQLGPASGGVTAVQTRSGSDAMHFTLSSFVPRVRFPDGTARVEAWEPNIGLSGPIARDRAFFEQSLSYRYDINFFDTQAGPQENNFRALMSWTQVDVTAPGQRVSFSASFDPQRTDHANVTWFTPRDTVPAVEQGGWTLGIVDHVVLGESSVFEARVNGVRTNLGVTPNGSEPYVLAHEVTRGSYFDTQDFHGDRVVIGADWTWTGWKHHVLKAGGTVARADLQGSASSTPVALLRSDGTPSQRVTFFGGKPWVSVERRESGLYVQDTWKPWAPLTVDAGLRYDRESLAQGPHVLPRGAWTLKFGDGRSTLGGSAGIFADKIPLKAQAFEAMPSRLVDSYDSAGDLVSEQRYLNTLDGQLHVPTATRWDVEFDRRSGSGWLARVR